MNRFTAFFPSRISRGAYLTRGVLLLLASGAVGGALVLASHVGLFGNVVLIGGGILAGLCFLGVLFGAVLIPRLRDIGLHPAWSLLILPHSLSFLFVLALLLLPTNAFAPRTHSPYASPRW